MFISFEPAPFFTSAGSYIIYTLYSIHYIILYIILYGMYGVAPTQEISRVSISPSVCRCAGSAAERRERYARAEKSGEIKTIRGWYSEGLGTR